jgi:hypothetical protein
MQKVEAFKLSNGALVENEIEAVARQRLIDYEEQVIQFVDRLDLGSSSKDTVRDVLLEKAHDIKKLLTIFD